MHGKKLLFLATFLTLSLVFAFNVQADGDHSSHSNVSDAISNFRGNDQQMPSDEHLHSEMNHDDGHTTMESSGHSGLNHEGEGHSDTSAIEETPPNYKVLGTFGLINFGFLSLGALLKIRKRKEQIYEVK